VAWQQSQSWNEKKWTDKKVNTLTALSSVIFNGYDLKYICGLYILIYFIEYVGEV